MVTDGGKSASLSGGWERLPDDIEGITTSKIFWNWQQPLRALRGMHQLETIYLIGSPDAAGYQPLGLDETGEPLENSAGFKQTPGSGKGSHTYLRLCQRLLEGYLPVGDGIPRAVIPWHVPVDFESFNDLTKELRNILRPLREKLSPRQILVDVTGGQKVTSIAGAVLTLNNELRFQYVQTNEPFGTVPYDLVQRTAPGLEPHPI